MKKLFTLITLVVSVQFSSFAATLGTTTGTDFTTLTWSNGASTTIGTWFLVQNGGSAFSIGDSSQGGRPTIGSSAFFIGPGNFNGANQGYGNAFFALTSPLSIGQTLSFDINFLFNNGTKGFELQTAGGAVSLFKVQQEWAEPVNATGGSIVGTNNVLANGFQKALRVEAESVTGGINFRIKEAGAGSFIIDNSFTTADALGQIRFYAGNTDPTQDANQASQGIYFNNITVIPEPSTPLLMGLGLAGLLALRKNRKA